MSEKKGDYFSSILSGVIGGVLFLFFAFFLSINFFLSLGIGIAGFIGSILLFSGRNKEVEIIVDGITREKYEEILNTGSKKLEILRSYLKKVNNAEVNKKIKDITDIVVKIFDDLKKDPKDVKAARQFLNYYLDTTINILNRYIDISSQNIQSEKVNDTLKKVEELLDTIKKAFEKQLEKLLNDDLLDLDSEIQVLEQTMKIEGVE